MKKKNSFWQQEQRILDVLYSLSYRTNEIDIYLHNIACAVSQLHDLDWSVVTLCWDDTERVMASSIDIGEGEHIYSLHGLLTNTVVKTGKTLCVEDTRIHPEYGSPPEGYVSYLGVPLRTGQGNAIGTICSFCKQPRQFKLDEIRTIELFAERAAMAIDNYNLYQQQKHFNELLETEVAKRTEELKQAQAKLIERERLAAIGEFAATIVHEIRNPVTTILMGLNYFKKISRSERDRIRVSLALEEASRLQNLLSEILLYAKPQVLQLEELELNESIAKILAVLQEMPEAEAKLIQFVPATTEVKIRADKDKLKQVLINTVRNAFEAISAGEVVTCKIEENSATRQIYLSVHNGGEPIPADILPKLTQPFCSTKSEGTGLGLAIVKRIVDAHGGSLTIESDRSTGTTVRIFLPLASQ